MQGEPILMPKVEPGIYRYDSRYPIPIQIIDKITRIKHVFLIVRTKMQILDIFE